MAGDTSSASAIPAISSASRQAWIEATGDADRKRIADDIQRFAFRDVPYYPLGRYWSPAAYRTGMDGVVPGPVPVFWNVGLPAT